MLIIALVLAVIGLAALVTAVVTSNELIAWVCIGASVLGVVLLIVDALRERSRSGRAAGAGAAAVDDEAAAESGVDETDEVDEEYDSSRDTQVIEAVRDTHETDEPVDYPEDTVGAAPEDEPTADAAETAETETVGDEAPAEEPATDTAETSESGDSETSESGDAEERKN
ncbi:hypothetical protein [Mycolicibacterium goodii]|uniref:Membrane protein n=1 Tax=Mycolicibacterium goodii TaxID=134601 RepID=A0A0K0X890_MYCGD|nr:membrane protein [Mycolicibacterium goodii]